MTATMRHPSGPFARFRDPGVLALACCASVVLLSACGGGQEDSGGADAATKADPTAAFTTTTPAQTVPELKRGAHLNRSELEVAEQQARAADTSPSQAALDNVETGEIAAKSAYLSGAVARKALAVRIPVYRFSNSSTGAHFFTTSTAERDNVVATLSPPFSLEGEAFSVASAFSPGLSSVHRFYNTQTGVHFYTISEAERANVVASFPHFSYEGVAYHASQVAGAGLTPFYRFYVPGKGFHFYTANEAEKDNIIANLAATYSYEGVGYHVLARDWRAEKLPHTGITSSQCFQTGSNVLTVCSGAPVTALNARQDGNRTNINPMSYSTVGGHALTQCVQDSITGLIWEGKEANGDRASGKTYTHLSNGLDADTSGYVAHVNTVALCGFNDWRLPTRQELLTLMRYGVSTAPFINTTWFPNTAESEHWSVELDSADNTRAWYVSFQFRQSNVSERSNVKSVRLVRGALPIGPRFSYSTVAYGVDGANNAVNDAWTGLQWRRCEQGRFWSGSACTGTRSQFEHEQALAHAQIHSDWRMPNVKELSSLVDLSPSSGAVRIDPIAFPGASHLSYWSSSPVVQGSTNTSLNAWIVTLYSGTVYATARDSNHAVRLVRTSP